MKILTYNILSPQLASWSNYKNHKYCNKKYIVWSYRKNKIKKILINSGADILCLQEMQNVIFSDFVPFFYKNGYIGIFIPKIKTIKNTIDGCAIFIKKTYQFIKIKSIDYENIYPKLLNNSDNLDKKKNKIIRGDQPMSGIVCLIKKINTGCQFVLATVHLISNPELSDIKHLQTLAVLKSLESMSNNGKIPYILCGDFNSLPSSSVYDTIINGNINYNHIDFKSHKNSIITRKKNNKLKMRSAYKVYHGYEAPFTNYTDTFNGTLDYIFISKKWNIRYMNKIPLIKDVTKEIGIPNSIIPSDHIPLICNLYF